MAMTSRGASCTEQDGAIRCEIGRLEPGDKVAIDMTVATETEFDAEELTVTTTATADQEDATEDNTTRITLPVKALRIFADGFE